MYPLPHDINILILPDDGIKLEPWPNSKGKAKLRSYINIELVLLLIGVETFHSIQEGFIRLVEVRVGEGNRGTKWQAWSTLAGLHVEYSRLEAGKSFLLETKAGVIRVVSDRVSVCM